MKWRLSFFLTSFSLPPKPRRDAASMDMDSDSSGESRSKVAASFDAMFPGVSFQSALLDESPLPDFPPCNFSSVTPPFSGSSLIASKTDPIVFSEIYYDQSQFQTPLSSPHQYSIGLDISSEPPPQLSQVTKPRLSSRRSCTAAESARRRANIAERMKRLEKMMPCKVKKGRATMLEEAYKYIKFLETQITALRSMPSSSSSLNGGGYGPLGRLNRQELLQAVVNSPASQMALYSHGCCVVSVEQLDLLKLPMQIEYSSSSSNFYPG